MFNIGGGELLVILLIALIVLGPQKLPEAARTVGRVVRELQRLSSGFQREFQKAIEDEELKDLDRGRTTTRPEPAPLASVLGDLDADEAVDEPEARAGTGETDGTSKAGDPDDDGTSKAGDADDADHADDAGTTSADATQADHVPAEATPAAVTPSGMDGNGTNGPGSGPNRADGADANGHRRPVTGDEPVADEVGQALDEILADDADGGDPR